MKPLLALAVLAIVVPAARAGLIVNGDFQAGNQDFITEYTFSPGNIGPQQTYDVLANPFPAHPSAHSYFDHTFNTAAGKMLAVNEANAAGVLVWGQTVGVTPGSDYVFTAYISSWVGAAPAELDVLFNGASIGVMQAPSTTGSWVQFTANWNSGAATSAVIELRNVNGADIGGDFALDDLSLDGPDPSAVPEPSGIVIACLGAAGLCWTTSALAIEATKVKRDGAILCRCVSCFMRRGERPCPSRLPVRVPVSFASE